VLCCVLASGIVCGFAAIKPILIAEGVYRSLCPADWSPPNGDEGQLPCPEQDMRLNLMFILASITLNMSNMLGGWVLDKYGRRMCYILAAVILFLGSGCMALAFQLGEALGHFDGYIVGNLLLGLGGTFLFVSSYQLSNAFPRHSGLIVALVTGAFDASAAVYLFYHLAYEATDHAFKPAYFFAAFAIAIPCLILLGEFTIMPPTSYVTKGEYQVAIHRAQDESTDIHDSDDEVYANRPRELLAARDRRAARREAELEAIETVAGTEAERTADRAAARDRQEVSGVAGADVRDLPFSRQVRTPWYWLIQILTLLQMMRMNYFIATVRAQYRYMLGSDELAGKVNSFFDVALPVAGVVTTPFIGILLNEVPVWGTQGVMTIIILILGLLNVLPELWAGYATVVAFVIFRPLYYSTVS
jgi:MFS family permease